MSNGPNSKQMSHKARKSHQNHEKSWFTQQISVKWCEALSFNSSLPTIFDFWGSTRSDMKKHGPVKKCLPKNPNLKNLAWVPWKRLFQLSSVLFSWQSVHIKTWDDAAEVRKNTAKIGKCRMILTANQMSHKARKSHQNHEKSSFTQQISPARGPQLGAHSGKGLWISIVS